MRRSDMERMDTKRISIRNMTMPEEKKRIRKSGMIVCILMLVFNMGMGVKAAADSQMSYAENDYDDLYYYESSDVQVNEDDMDLLVLPGEGYQLTFSDSTRVASVSYTTDNAAVAVVSDTGFITGIAAGQTTIHVIGTDTSGYTFSGTVYVYSPSLSATEILANLGLEEKYDGYYYIQDDISLEYIPSSAMVTVTTDSDNLAAIYSSSYWGRYVALKAKQEGNYTVTITVNDKIFTVSVKLRNLYFDRHEKTACDLESYNSDKSSLVWKQGSSMLALYKGETATLRLNGVMETEKVQWSSSNKSVASVNSKGKVTAKGVGSATITASVGGFTVTYEVGVSYKTAIKALRYDIEHFHSTYSQAKRMSEGYYDCSSFVWRGYKAAGKYLNKNGGWAPTAADLAKWCVSNNYMLYEGIVPVSKLLPGDLIFEMDSSEANGRYKGIYHVDMYQGNGTMITVERQKYAGDQLYNVMVARPCVPTPALKAKKSGKSIKLTWNGVYGVTGYKVYRSDSKNGKYKCIGTVKNAKEFKDATAKKGKTYYYKLRAYWKMDGHTYYGKYSAVVKKKR